jgi:short subunit dehydrogenase
MTTALGTTQRCGRSAPTTGRLQSRCCSLNQLRRASKAPKRQIVACLSSPKHPPSDWTGVARLSPVAVGTLASRVPLPLGKLVLMSPSAHGRTENSKALPMPSVVAADRPMSYRLIILIHALYPMWLAQKDACDILVNSAGTNRPKFFGDAAEEEDYDAVLDLNLRANVFVAQTVAQKMVTANRKGTIIQMSSQMGTSAARAEWLEG